MSREGAPECLQLPSWDEFDPAAELDYGEDEPENNGDAQGREEVLEPVPCSSSPFHIEEPCSSSASNGIPQVPSNADHLPRVADPQPSRTVNIGPALPPGLLSLHQDDSAPEDPAGYPEDPGMAQMGNSRGQGIGPRLPQVLVPASLPAGSSRPPVPSRVGPMPNMGTNRSPAVPRGRPSTASSSSVVLGPSLPSHLVDSVAPSLPDDELRAHSVNGLSQEREVRSSSASLPPPEPEEPRAASAPTDRRQIGPALPPDLLLPGGDGDNGDDGEDSDEDSDMFGPMPPPASATDLAASRGRSLSPDMPEEEEGDEVIGPMPPGEQDQDRAAEEYAYRRLALEREKEIQNGSKREEWMTQLPQKLTNYGLGARTFKKGSAPGEKDSSWTETPEQKRLRIERGEPSTSSDSAPSQAQRMRDEEQARMAAQLNANRSDPLLDVHQRKRKADNGEAEGTNGVSGRQGFDRERDMDVHALKGSSAKEMKERCGQLSTRFGHSNNQKFL